MITKTVLDGYFSVVLPVVPLAILSILLYTGIDLLFSKRLSECRINRRPLSNVAFDVFIQGIVFWQFACNAIRT